MSYSEAQQEQWTQDNAALARIGAALYKVDTRIPVQLARSLADTAVAAWNRDEPEGGAQGWDDLDEATETDAERTIRHRAGTLALIGAGVEDRARPLDANTISVELDAWFIGLALETADDHGLIKGPWPTVTNPQPRFITVDVDVRSNQGNALDALVTSLSRAGTIQNHQRGSDGHFVSFALGEQYETIVSDIGAITRLLDSLDADARAQWDDAASRIFNVGIEAGREQDQPIITLDADLVSLAARYSAGITFTLYPSHKRSAVISHTTIS